MLRITTFLFFLFVSKEKPVAQKEVNVLENMFCFSSRLRLIGTHNQHLQKFAFSNGFKSSIETFKKASFTKVIAFMISVGIATMTSISAFRIFTDKKDSTQTKIYDLEEIVKKRALYAYDIDKKHRIMSFLQNVPDIKMDWDDVTFDPKETEFEEIGSNDTAETRENRKISKFITVFKNKSCKDQVHKLTTERQLSRVCESSMTEGYSIGSEVGLFLTASKDTDFPIGFSLQHSKGNKDVDKHSWCIENSVTVPQKSIVTVTRLLKEEERQYRFKTPIKVSGDVNFTFYNQKGQIVGHGFEPMHILIDEEFPKKMTNKMENNIIEIIINGRCKFQTRTDEIEITQEHE